MSEPLAAGETAERLEGEMVVLVASVTKRPQPPPAPDAAASARVRGSPNYQDMMPKPLSTRAATRREGSRTISIELKTYPSRAVVVLVRERVPDVFSLGLRSVRDGLSRLAHELAREEGCVLEDPEEYAIYCVSGFRGDPGALIDANRHAIVQLLKSEDLPLHEDEVRATLDRALRYGRGDRAIIDWDGAFLFDAMGDFASDVAVLEIANRTLLRYRLLDRRLNAILDDAVTAVKDPPRSFIGRLGEVRKRMREIAEIRLDAIRELGRIDGDIKLYGNWYLARLYDLTSKVFHVEDWRRIVTSNVEQLEQLYQMAAENFTARRTERLELIQLVGWTVLLAGYFLLFFFELGSAA
jgi:hypothetical protein